ncbi:hypothetical protein K0504_09720 [Neiella marina]|uniref:Uncharacterized protein n=1 Tax=Neiella holothuriorum TaxID=2870530 RepID=A0ABS7EG38_9GAMM|nr:hypothetical protein [Neiella holothuriorum]MBW8191314.1 hypothetical protein [Neiella holothuriorum]
MGGKINTQQQVAWQLVAEIATMYVTGWLMRSADDGDRELINDIADGFQNVSQRIDQLNQRLDQVIAILHRLPAIMTGLLNKSEMASALNEATGHLNNIVPYLQSEDVFRRNARTVRNQCEAMWPHMSNYIARSDWKERGPIDVMVTLAPHFAVFAKAYTYSNHYLHTANPRGSKVTAWDHPASKICSQIFERFFKLYEDTEVKSIEASERLMPTERVVGAKRLYDFAEGEGFAPTPYLVPSYLGGDIARGLQFKFSAWVFDDNVQLTIVRRWEAGDPPQYPGHGWALRQMPRTDNPRHIPHDKLVVFRHANEFVKETFQLKADWRNLHEITGDIREMRRVHELISVKPPSWS